MATVGRWTPGTGKLMDEAQHCPVEVLMMLPRRSESSPSFLPMSMASLWGASGGGTRRDERLDQP